MLYESFSIATNGHHRVGWKGLGTQVALIDSTIRAPVVCPIGQEVLLRKDRKSRLIGEAFAHSHYRYTWPQ